MKCRACLLAAVVTWLWSLWGQDRPAPNARQTRSEVIARRAAIATSQPLASEAGLRMLRSGGNAIDAAVAAAAVLNVVEPMMTGIGGDVFALVYWARENKLYGLNASGWAGSDTSLDRLRQKGLREVPVEGLDSVTVPGAVAGWEALSSRFGKKPWKELLQPAIEYAREGYAASPIIAHSWNLLADKLRRFPTTRESFLFEGQAPRVGQIVRLPDLARSLEQLADEGPRSFYEGSLARQIVDFIQSQGGPLSLSDLREYRPEWADPISTDYRSYRVCELPPNGQGIAVLQMLNILEGFDLRSMKHNGTDYLHLLIEAKKLAFADLYAYVADPSRASVPVEGLLSKDYAAKRRGRIDPSRAATQVEPGLPVVGDTVYLTVADAEGNMVSFINSLFHGFGSGVVAGKTGIVLQNRGALFSLDPSHPNRLEPRKRPFHTIIPAMVFFGGKPWLSFGVMGGSMQPQGHVQVLLNLIDFGMNIQQAGEAPRFRHDGAFVSLESGIDTEARRELIERGHRILEQSDVFGGFQGILRDPATGAYHAGSDPRKDGLAIGY